MGNISQLHADPYAARVRRIARWLDGRAGRTERTLKFNLGSEANRYLAALVVAGVSMPIAMQHAEQFRADVLARLDAIRRANAEMPAAIVIRLPVLCREGAAA